MILCAGEYIDVIVIIYNFISEGAVYVTRVRWSNLELIKTCNKLDPRGYFPGVRLVNASFGVQQPSAEL